MKLQIKNEEILFKLIFQVFQNILKIFQVV